MEFVFDWALSSNSGFPFWNSTLCATFESNVSTHVHFQNLNVKSHCNTHFLSSSSFSLCLACKLDFAFEFDSIFCFSSFSICLKWLTSDLNFFTSVSNRMQDSHICVTVGCCCCIFELVRFSAVSFWPPAADDDNDELLWWLSLGNVETSFCLMRFLRPTKEIFSTKCCLAKCYETLVYPNSQDII